jgi:lipopolysaccharide/colanic/teichoic acid biosynthesis glycosyltransferase
MPPLLNAEKPPPDEAKRQHQGIFVNRALFANISSRDTGNPWSEATNSRPPDLEGVKSSYPVFLTRLLSDRAAARNQYTEMSVQLLESPPKASSSDLSDVVNFASSEFIADVPWLTKLHLGSRRRNVRCLGPELGAMKRAVDVVVSLILIALLWPVMLLTALLVKMTSRGPVIFRQTRVGLNLRTGDRRNLASGPPEPPGERRALYDRRGNPTYGRHFTLYKFRTMRIDAEKNGAQFAQKNDSRITPVGRFLRKTRLDELPQLWNVLKGEMTLVGPRPERPEFLEKLSEKIPNYLQRLGLKPGLTGVAQIVNGYDNEIESFRRKVAFDLLYLQNCCLWNDIKILFRTIRTVLTGSGAL